MNSQKHKNYVKGAHWYELFEYDAELSISTQAAMDYYDNFRRNWKGNLWMIKRSYKNPKGQPVMDCPLVLT